MFRQALLSVLVGGFLLAIGSTTASAQGVDYNNWTRTNHGAAPQVDKWGIPCPAGGCQKMINDAKQHRKHHHQEAQNNNDEATPRTQTQEQDDAGYLNGRPFFSNNANDQPK